MDDGGEMKINDVRVSDFEAMVVRMNVTATVGEWRDVKRCLELGEPATFGFSLIIREMLDKLEETHDYEKDIFPDGADNSLFAALLDCGVRDNGVSETVCGVERGGDCVGGDNIDICSGDCDGCGADETDISEQSDCDRIGRL